MYENSSWSQEENYVNIIKKHLNVHFKKAHFKSCRNILIMWMYCFWIWPAFIKEDDLHFNFSVDYFFFPDLVVFLWSSSLTIHKLMPTVPFFSFCFRMSMALVFPTLDSNHVCLFNGADLVYGLRVCWLLLMIVLLHVIKHNWEITFDHYFEPGRQLIGLLINGLILYHLMYVLHIIKMLYFF